MVLGEDKILKKPIIATDYTTVRDQLSDDKGMVVELLPNGIASGIQKMFEK